MEHPSPRARGPYARNSPPPVRERGRPSDIVAANVRDYRMLRQLTQEGLAARMARLGHGWTRSTVSAAESRARNLTVDELFGLALSLGVSLNQVLDPAGPDRSRRPSLDVGVRASGADASQPLDPALARLWSSSRAVLRLGADGAAELEVDIPDDQEVAVAV